MPTATGTIFFEKKKEAEEEKGGKNLSLVTGCPRQMVFEGKKLITQ